MRLPDGGIIALDWFVPDMNAHNHLCEFHNIHRQNLGPSTPGMHEFSENRYAHATWLHELQQAVSVKVGTGAGGVAGAGGGFAALEEGGEGGAADNDDDDWAPNADLRGADGMEVPMDEDMGGSSWSAVASGAARGRNRGAGSTSAGAARTPHCGPRILRV